jgi:hypothetical protein
MVVTGALFVFLLTPLTERAAPARACLLSHATAAAAMCAASISLMMGIASVCPRFPSFTGIPDYFNRDPAF